MRLKLVPKETKVDFFSFSKITISLSSALVIGTIIAFFTMGLNFGIDFRGGVFTAIWVTRLLVATWLLTRKPKTIEV